MSSEATHTPEVEADLTPESVVIIKGCRIEPLEGGGIKISPLYNGLDPETAIISDCHFYPEDQVLLELSTKVAPSRPPPEGEPWSLPWGFLSRIHS